MCQKALTDKVNEYLINQLTSYEMTSYEFIEIHAYDSLTFPEIRCLYPVL